jgi:hypothetical protein
MRLLLPSLVLALAACSNTTDLRPVSGRLSSGLSQGTIVIAETADGVRTIAAPAANGVFLIPVHVDTASRLSVAKQVSPGHFKKTVRVGPSWFTIKHGEQLDLGEVRESGEQSSAGTTAGATHLCPGESDDDSTDGGHNNHDGHGGHDGDADGGSGDHSGSGSGNSGSHDGDDDRADGGTHHEDGDDDGQCSGVEVEGCEQEQGDCDHDDQLPATTGPADLCSGVDGGVTGTGTGTGTTGTGTTTGDGGIQ